MRPHGYLAPVRARLSPSPALTQQSSFIVQKWHGLTKVADAYRVDKAVYVQIPNVNPEAAMHWQRYEQCYGGPSALWFQDVPWPIMLTPHDGSHIRAVDVHMFVLPISDLENVPPSTIPGSTAEIERWETDRFAAQVLPRVIPFERKSVAAAAGAVLDILLKPRRDVMSLLAAA
ncbi:hypothetical protein B0H12DRAFT_421915 [Mycena haematopus]|nr:hypothetical protein B0H12DRAFT_421915 [Mycena haematopus]